MAKTRPRILLYDLETSPMLVTTWGLFQPIIQHQNIVQESVVLSGAWKWHGEDTIHAVAVNPKSPTNDLRVVKRLHKVLSEADVIVAHNGDKFDLRKFNARAAFHELTPLPPIAQIDTLKVARKHFAFNSNRLDYLGKFLCGTGKLPTPDGLWTRVMNKDAEALATMVEYNKRDVTVLEKVYLRLRPYMRNHPNAALYNEVECCPICGEDDYVKQGFKYQKTTKRQQYQCRDCGAWFCGEYLAKAWAA